MSKTGFPSLTALLGLLAVAGYQNRDKLAEWFGPNAQSGAGGAGGAGTGAPAGLDRILAGFGGSGGGMAGGVSGGLAGAGGVGGMISGGIGELIERFRGVGRGEAAESWVKTGPNAALHPEDLERALGPDTLDDLAARTGLSRVEVVQRLGRELPDAVDRYTPEGRL